MIIDPYRFGIANSAAALDAYTTDLWFAGGIRRLLASYPQASPLIRVRRSSDNAEMDVLANSPTDPTLNTGSITSWSGSDSVFVTTVYNQLNNSNSFVQATAGAQPRLYNAGAYDGFLRYDGSDDLLTSANSIPSTSGLTMAICAANRAASDGVWAYITNVFTAANKAVMWNRQTTNDRDEIYITQSAADYQNWGSATYSPGVATMAGRSLKVSVSAVTQHATNGAANSNSYNFAVGSGPGSGDYNANTLNWGHPTNQLSTRAFALWTAGLSDANTVAVSSALNI